MVTVEGAYAIAAIVTTVVFGVGAVAGASVQIRCTDAAREAARLAAVGDRSAQETATAVAGRGAQITLSDTGTRVVAEVRAGIPLVPMLEVSARAVAAKEPDDGADLGMSGAPPTAAEPEDPP
ncbi:TadE family type IV pilus minor pilin [Gordonia sp. OPL2]|uniref:TadE family type IV pilus minor pilin n=1 Tax=Gordonia sp. OPL2 TaxID=2486274 RepID=UPI00165521BA|nr:TadE family type IV pilus minor pilin [Gordonia sp. OPL2]ROZ98556.1 pilus assembly protein TadE [Gordonia sp. OPL2]